MQPEPAERHGTQASGRIVYRKPAGPIPAHAAPEPRGVGAYQDCLGQPGALAAGAPAESPAAAAKAVHASMHIPHRFYA